MSYVYAAYALIAVGTAAYGADTQRKAANSQKDALAKAQADDASEKAAAETSATLAANTKLAQDKRARQASVLALGGGTSIAPPASVLGSGAPTVTAGRPVSRGSTGAF